MESNSIPVPRINHPDKFNFIQFEKHHREDLTELYLETKRFVNRRNIKEIWKNIDYGTFAYYIYQNSFKSKPKRL